LVRGLIIFGLAALVGAWWYVRNWVLYGDPLAWQVWLADIGVHPIGLIELIRQFGHVGTSFWSPYDELFPPTVFWALGLLVAIAVAGWAWLCVRLVRRNVCVKVNAEGLLLAGVWFVLLFGGLIRYMATTPSAEGRLLFPGIASFSLLLVLGWEAVLPRRWMRATMGAVVVGLLALSIFNSLAIASRYALPLLESVEDASGAIPFGDATFGAADSGGIRLMGVEVEPGQAQPGETVDVTLYWEAVGTPPADLRAVVRLWTLGGRLAAQRDTTPAGETYPPDLWRAGDVVSDVYRLPVEESGPAMCRVTVDVLAAGESLGNAVSPPVLKLIGTPVAVDEVVRPLAYTLGDRVELIDCDISDEPPTTTLYWRVLGGMDEDYTVFVHLLDGNGELIGQGDGPPLEGDYPTSYWSPGDTLADTHVVPLEGDLPAGARFLVGLYRPADGARLPVYTATGERVPNDAILLNINICGQGG
jgi:hypothetical protein